MTATVDNIRFILYDLKYSWWFRFWGLLWLASFIISIIALGVLAKRADVRAKENDFHVWIENASELYFPRFHFRIAPDSPGIKIQNKNCSHAGIGIHTQDCQTWDGRTPDSSLCFAVLSDSIKVINHNYYHQWGDVAIDCWINTTIPTSREDLLIAMEFEGDNHATGGDSLASVWIAPTEGAWILLNNEKLFYNGNEYNDWHRKLIYQSSIRERGMYKVAVVMNSFFVSHVDQADSYTGWMAIGEAGGFAYFTVILHFLLMIPFGFCLTNNSKFFGR